MEYQIPDGKARLLAISLENQLLRRVHDGALLDTEDPVAAGVLVPVSRKPTAQGLWLNARRG